MLPAPAFGFMEDVDLLVSVSVLGPGAPLDDAVALADALDARRVPLTLLVGPRPHPEVTAWANARRHVGDSVLLHGTRPEPAPGRPYKRLPAHEARLRLAGALRSRDALGLPVDGFAAPGWAVSPGVRRALAEAGIGLCLDDAGAHRLGPDGTPLAQCPARFTATRRRPACLHLALEAEGATSPDAGARVDEVLAAGATPRNLGELVAGPSPRPAHRSRPADPEHWSITA